MNSSKECYTLNNGLQIPCIGFGTYKAAQNNEADVIRSAIQSGYRYFDTASFYGTEEVLGQEIKNSGIAREEFFITSKLWKDEMGYENALGAFEKTLARLDMEYLDLYLIHWPKKTSDMEGWKELDTKTWQALEELYRLGKVKAIGLSNFLPHHIDNILQSGTIKPAVDQLEFHPGYTQESAVHYCEENKILVQAWSPLGRQRVLKEPLISELAAKYQVSEAQICIRYIVQRGIVPLPKASSCERMKQNLEVFHFEISKEDMYRISCMPQAGWSGEHPDREREVL